MKLFLILVFLGSFFFFPSFKGKKYFPEGNHPPAVEIINPEGNSFSQWNTNVRYKVDVSDQEDGKSEYGEISPKEVVLEVKYKAKLSRRKLDSIKKNIKIPKGLSLIESHNCFNCHQLNAKSTGPSFKRINEHYEHSNINIRLLLKHIINGSSGVWGDQTMPGHAELTMKEAAEIVNWIFMNAKDSTIQFYTGTHGFFRIKPHDKRNTSMFIILTASYTDHGLNGENKQRLSGSDRIIIHVE